MSDSLRDQLLKAGFSEPEKKPKPAAKSQNKSLSRKPKKGQSTGQSQTAKSPSDNQPKAGYLHVPTVAPKKKKRKKAPAVKPRAGSWGTRDHSAGDVPDQPKDPEAADRRRKMKAEIQALIEANAEKNIKGDEVYRFTSRNKIRELMVNEPVRKRLGNSELAITRLNGISTLIPSAIALKIRNINPQWPIFIASDTQGDGEDDTDFPVPDDLIW
jgi:uncharacterized protein YaiL (DUF2058 family)